MYTTVCVGKDRINEDNKTESKPLKEPLERGHGLATDQEAECMKSLYLYLGRANQWVLRQDKEWVSKKNQIPDCRRSIT